MESKFIDDIKDSYKRGHINREKQWPIRNSSELFKLKLVWRKGYFYSYHKGAEDRAGQQISIAYENLFAENQERKVRTILVEGDSGIGKTTFCTSLAEDWANKSLFNDFELLLLLPLRLKNVALASSLSELLKILHSSEPLCKFIEEYLTRNRGKNVLIVADGWDELSESSQNDQSFLYNFLLGGYLPNMSVLLTSRPSASVPLHDSCIDRFIEIHGFDKDTIEKFIESEFKAINCSAKPLLEQLKNNPLVESVCRIPLNCSILCQLWQTCEALPTTMTGLYTKMILNIVHRNINVKPNQNITELPDFDALQSDLQEQWWRLCEFAFLTKENNQLTFSELQLRKFFPRYDEKIFRFGLLQSNEKVLETGSGKRFHFLHHTFHEYLAALHLAKQPPCKQVSLFQSPLVIDNDSYPSEDFVMVLKFFFGIYYHAMQNKSTGVVVMLKFMKLFNLDSVKQFLGTIQDKSFLCHCAFEAKHPNIYKMVISFLSINPDSELPQIDFGYSRTTYDCEAVIDIITRIQKCGGMVIKFGESGVQTYQIKKLTKALGSGDQVLPVVMLDLSGNKLSDECISNLFLSSASSTFKLLESLNLSGNEIQHQGISSIVVALKNALITDADSSALTYLNLSENHLGKLSLQSLEKAVNDGILANLSELNLQKSLTDDAVICLTTFIRALLAHCPKLKHFDLGYNSLGEPGVSALASQNGEYASRLFLLGLNGTEIGDGAFQLVGPYNLHVLQLMNNDISAIGIKHLSDLFSKEPVPAEDSINLDGNPLGLEGAFHIGRMLGSKYCRLTSLTLSGCKLTSSLSSEALTVHYGEVKNMQHQMPQCLTISRLNLNNNNFSGRGIYVFAGFLYLCPYLNNLKSSDCGITSGDINTLLNVLDTLIEGSQFQPCSELNEWILSNNKIDSEGENALRSTQASSCFPCLKGDQIHLDGNPVCIPSNINRVS